MTNEKWDLVLEPKRKLFDLQIREVIRYRDLIFLFIKRDFVMQYKQTILGPLWFLINPIFSTVMYMFVFGNIAHIGTDGVPFLLFYYTGTMLWSFFADCFNNACNIFSNNSALFGKVYFPRLTVPISNVVNSLIKVVVQFIILIALLIYYLVVADSVHLSWLAFGFPFLLLWIAAIGTGMGMIVSSLTTKYRDLKLLVSFALGLAMYATPIVYPISQMPARFAWVNYINPVSAPVELFRVWWFGAGSVSLMMIISSLALTTLCVFFGLILFNQNERNFVDVM